MALRTLSWPWLRRFDVRQAILLVVLVATAAVLVGDGVIVVTVDRRLAKLASALPESLRTHLRACDQDPTSWRPRRIGNLRVDAFDAATYVPLAGGGELDQKLLHRLRAGEIAPRRRAWLWGRGSAVLVRVPEGGRCGVVQLRRAPDLEHDLVDIGLLVLAIGLVAGVAVLLAYLTSMRPMFLRLRRLRHAASTVAHADGYFSATDSIPDDIGRIAQALDTADSRIRQDSALLQWRGEELERHLADVAHDVRTPLGALQLALETAAKSPEASEQKRCVEAALADATYLAALLENLQLAALFDSGIEPGEAETSLVDLCRVVDSMDLRFELLARKQQVELAVARPDDAVLIRADAILVERAVSNLVHNAIIHGRADGHVAILLERGAEGHYLLSISDDGPGIEPAELSDLNRQALLPFPRPRDGRRLGLAITCAIFQRAGCTVHFQPNIPNGLRVEIKGREGKR